MGVVGSQSLIDYAGCGVCCALELSRGDCVNVGTVILPEGSRYVTDGPIAESENGGVAQG